MTEKEKMKQGLWYDANFDSELVEQRKQVEDLCFVLNQTPPSQKERREEILKDLLPHKEEGVDIQSPFYVDYGKNCWIGENSFLNRGAYLMDGAKITIGKRCFIGPFVGMYTANHPLDVYRRQQGLEKAEPICIGDDVWIGANVVILPGVSIGSRSVIGAGSVVTRSIPEGVLAAGNPCRIIKKIEVDV